MYITLLYSRVSFRTLVLLRQTLLGLALVVFASDLLADANPVLRIELNKLEQQGDACVAYLVFNNERQDHFKVLKLELVFFDSDGLIQRRLTLDVAPLAASKTMVKLFKIPDSQCDSLGHLLINDIVRCQGSDGPIGDCLDRLVTSSRNNVGLIK